MDRLTSMSVFVKVVARHSFAVAARELRLSRAGVSKHVLALEQSLGVRLLNRNTRRLSLTEVGTVVHERHARIDLIEEGFDVAVRIGHLADSNLIARRLAPIRLVLCTSPEYLARYGAPTHPSELQHHDCVVYIFREGHAEWRFVGPDGAEETVPISGRLRANNGNLLRVAVLKGQGIGLAPTFLVGEDLAAGRLLRLLPDYAPVEEDLAAVYPHRRQLSAKVRSFVDFLAERFAGEPEWDRWRDSAEVRP
jgi:DNA-binding transcriptional LysR family regulator